jgi:PAS domain S-box-containing protein
MDMSTPLYNSRLVRIYIEYLNSCAPGMDSEALLERAGLEVQEVDDPAHWFTQAQVDRFHQVLAEETKNPAIAREAGRYAASAEALGTIKTHLLGLLSPARAYELVGKVAGRLTRHSRMEVKKISANRMEILSIPGEGVVERPYQCENRFGMLESLPRLFPAESVQIEHSECLHRGGSVGRYIVTFRRSAAFTWKRIRDYTLLAGVPAALVSSLFLPGLYWWAGVALCALLVMVAAMMSGHIEKETLKTALQAQSDVAERFEQQIDVFYSNARLFRELGQATSSLLIPAAMCRSAVKILKRHLDYDRAFILLPDPAGETLCFTAGYGFRRRHRQLLARVALRESSPRRVLSQAFLSKKPLLVNDVVRSEARLPEASRGILESMGVRSFIAVPIIYGGEALGVLGVDNLSSRRSFTQSDLNLLLGAASEIAVSIKVADSFHRLRQSEQRYRSIFESTSNPTVIIDGDTTLRLVNEQFARLTGYTKEELEGKKSWLDFVVEEDASWMKEYHYQRRTGPESVPNNYICRVRDREGKEREIFLTVSLIPESSQSVASLSDISELRRAEEEKRALEARLRQAQRMEAVGTLAGGIAHDFNNLLMGIQGISSLLLQDMDAQDPSCEKLKQVEEYARRGEALTRQLLGFARGGKYEVKPTDLNTLIAKSLQLFGRTHKEISLHTDYQAKIWPAAVDRGQIDQVLLNLFVNAWQAMPGGGELFVKTENALLAAADMRLTRLPPGKYVRITVRDTGVGMDEATRKRIFDPFFTTRNRERGTGLGLASAYGIISNHHGLIQVESSPGKGSCFTLYLPASPLPAEAEREPAAVPVRGSETVLLVEDEKIVLNVSRKLLEKLGYGVITAQSGDEAVRIYQEKGPEIDLVLLDMIMPGKGGSATFDALKDLDPGVRVLLSSGYSRDGQAEEILARGCGGFIQKPFNLGLLSQKLRQVLDEQPA